MDKKDKVEQKIHEQKGNLAELLLSFELSVLIKAQQTLLKSN